MLHLIFALCFLMGAEALVQQNHGKIVQSKSSVMLCLPGELMVPNYMAFIEKMQMVLLSKQFGSMQFKEDQQELCKDIDVWQTTVTTIKNYIFNSGYKSERMEIRLRFYEPKCIEFCPGFSVEEFSYRLESKIDIFKIVVTVVGCLAFFFSYYLVSKVWFIYSCTGCVVGGIL